MCNNDIRKKSRNQKLIYINLTRARGRSDANITGSKLRSKVRVKDLHLCHHLLDSAIEGDLITAQKTVVLQDLSLVREVAIGTKSLKMKC